MIDKSISEDFVVGSYRLLLKPKIKKSIFTVNRICLSKLLKNKNLSLLEAGRSCVHENYRDGRIIKLYGKAWHLI